MYKYDAKGNLYTVTDVTTGSDKLMAKYSYDANDKFCNIWQWYINNIYIQ